ncbi:MAG: integrase [Ignavibacterium sp.]|uniref:tyrosine-type recombinase/integrase n=1 Tax=Ignavibacterium sp. TaxID=2651167 RepID=UPI0021DEB1BE|nr:tyrosine-type recombinase/integrase [Ignavibacterium sp.]BDQ03591.1 MAG: integrase [Ignavibacterium sp.]GIV45597.1 MAG: integrase [Ignavibacterium sp.]
MKTNKIALLREVLSLRNYSPQTIKTYLKAVETYNSFSGLQNPSQQSLYKFALHLKEKNLSFSHIKNSIMAVKLYSEIVFGVKLNSNFLRGYRKERKLPDVLSIEEVKSIINCIENLKHRTIISLIYSCGLRISECVNLKVKDIDSKRMLLRIEQSKGNKDRFVPLSDKMLALLREYYKVYKPNEFIFEGQFEKYYSTRSIQAILKRALRKCNIKKHITVHSLRHSYATHLLEQGTDISIIQKILGHRDIKTTLLYTQISKSQLNKIKNPFDTF